MPVKKSAAKAKAPEAKDDCCAKCEVDIANLRKQVSDLENKLKGLFEGIDAASKLKGELEEAKEKLGSEVKELQENAKSWVQKTKESMDSNNDGKVDLEEIYSYVWKRMRDRRRSVPRK